jgi:hypothetical protein
MPVLPSEKEEHYFLKLEIERKKKHEAERHAKIAEEEKKRRKDLHYMHCPKCGVDLTEIDYEGVKVDKCFSCGGVWLDAGELELVSKFETSTLDAFLRVFKR